MKNESEAYIFDFSSGERVDVSDKIEEMIWMKSEEDDKYTGVYLVVSFSTIEFPSSTIPDTPLVVVVSVPTRHETILGWDHPVMWKDNVRNYYENSLNFFKTAYRKDGLRCMLFGDEIGISNNTFFIWIEDFNDDSTAMNYYHQWLEERFESIEKLNQYLGTNYNAFIDVKWNITSPPYESIEHLKEIGNFSIYLTLFNKSIG